MTSHSYLIPDHLKNMHSSTHLALSSFDLYNGKIFGLFYNRRTSNLHAQYPTTLYKLRLMLCRIYSSGFNKFTGNYTCVCAEELNLGGKSFSIKIFRSDFQNQGGSCQVLVKSLLQFIVCIFYCSYGHQLWKSARDFPA